MRNDQNPPCGCRHAGSPREPCNACDSADGAALPELIAEFVVANRILADQGVVADGFGHLSFSSPTDPNRFYMSRARAAGMVVAEDVMEFDLDGRPIDCSASASFTLKSIALGRT